jgi:AcrR family transcriptional regulator
MTVGFDPMRGVRLTKVQRRALLISAAREVFVTYGYHAASMDEIAERAGVSKPVLYQHFEDGKLSLYIALVDITGKELLQRLTDALASTQDNKHRVAATIGAYFDFVEDPEGSYRLVFESDLSHEPTVRDKIEFYEDECAVLVSAVIAEDTGLNAEEAMILAMGLTGMAETAARRWLREGCRVPKRVAVTLATRLAWRGISGVPRVGSSE